MQVQFGSGHNLLPGWDNRDSETDIRKALPFPIASVEFILAEHVIEHVEFREGLEFLRECCGYRFRTSLGRYRLRTTGRNS